MRIGVQFRGPAGVHRLFAWLLVSRSRYIGTSNVQTVVVLGKKKDENAFLPQPVFDWRMCRGQYLGP